MDLALHYEISVRVEHHKNTSVRHFSVIDTGEPLEMVASALREMADEIERDSNEFHPRPEESIKAKEFRLRREKKTIQEATSA